MEWFFEKRNKSVATNAQRIVADMHRHLDQQTKKAKEFEEIMLKFKELNIVSLEKEIQRLQKRKKDLAQELAEVDTALIDATQSLQDLQDRMERALQLPVPELTTGLNQKPTTKVISTPKEVAVEANILQTLQAVYSKHLFYIHQNKTDSFIIFIAALKENHLVEAKYLVDYHDSEGRDLTPSEDSMYGVHIVPNHQRDFPHVSEMVCPPFLATTTHLVSSGSGTLVCAFEIALTSAVIVDVWQNAEGIVWATTTIDGHSFAVLERMFVMSETSWGLQSIVQVDLCGRDAKTGGVIVEHVSASEEAEDD